MIKKTSIVIVLLLAAVSVYFLKFKNNVSSLNENETSFAIKDTASIDKIFLADRTNAPITLTKISNVWFINGTQKANPLVVAKLLKTMYGLSIKSPAPKAGVDDINKYLIGKGVKVEVYSKNQKVKCYYVGNTDQNYGTYMILEESKIPYSVILEGFSGYLTPRYRVDLKEWRDKTIFQLDNKNIKSIKIEYTYKNMENVYYTDDKVNRVLKNFKNEIVPHDKVALDLWLQAYNNFVLEDFDNYLNKVQEDSVLKTKPIYTVNLTTHDNKEFNWLVYRVKVPESNTDGAGNAIDYDIDRALVYLNKKELVYIQYANLDPKTKPLSYFIPTVKK